LYNPFQGDRLTSAGWIWQQILRLPGSERVGAHWLENMILMANIPRCINFVDTHSW